jgi:hypothetical protein
MRGTTPAANIRARAREIQVLSLLEKGLNYREVATIIGGSRNMVAGLAYRATRRSQRSRVGPEKSEAPEATSEASSAYPQRRQP